MRGARTFTCLESHTRVGMRHVRNPRARHGHVTSCLVTEKSEGVASAGELSPRLNELPPSAGELAVSGRDWT
eukprot:9497281-Pyramimonas_sp.AAC.2